MGLIIRTLSAACCDQNRYPNQEEQDQFMGVLNEYKLKHGKEVLDDDDSGGAQRSPYLSAADLQGPENNRQMFLTGG